MSATVPPVASKREVLERLQDQRSRLREFGVRRCGLFGSFLRDQVSNDSDVDLLVEFEPTEETFDNFMELGFFLEKLLGRRVETLSPEWLSPYIGPHILREVEYVAIAP